MYIKSINLLNFRNYDNLELNFNNKINIIYGDNATGKTNILESIYISCITKSYRAYKDIEYIKFNKNLTKIKAFFDKTDVEFSLTIENEKNILEDNIKVSKYSEFIGKNLVVIFSPENMNIVIGAPQKRRKFIDIIISQISKQYIIKLQEYNKLITIKNNLLKEKNIDYIYLDILNEKISENIEYICSQRKKYLEELQKYSEDIHKKMTNKKETLKIIYESDFKNKNKKEIFDILKENINSDIYKKTSTKGINKDDILIFINEKDVSKFGSQGQKRTCLLSIKFAEAKLLKEEKNEEPIILLDDVFSELDNKRINDLLQFITDNQVFITTTNIDNINSIENIKIFNVLKNGFVKEN